MANLYRSVLSSGETAVETILWTNPSPTSSISSETTYTISSIANYDFIRVYFRRSTSDSTETSVLYTKPEFLALTGTDKFRASGSLNISGVNYARPINVQSATSITVGYCYKLGSSAGQSNSYLIPTKICGLNYSLNTLYNLIKKVGVSNAGTGSTNQSFSATVGKRYLVMAYRYSTSGTASNAGISSGATVDTSYFNNTASSSSGSKLWVAIVTATSSTVTLLGTNNGACFIPLD